ncbi:5-formyltetrahydrofolate cyclo-ligase [Heyndrickxia sporothermodurans]|uniref:5-formyltetrahydrofolate cyclo-ligase n=1 Tax=Heyndrickxia sporothermodurans TaxID=46224 RepID=A0AB37HG21_9BACI|nr:5-formyltetrahydrofolate cyclo-ligase [Heyndrickxia sporothermodurans]MBL5766062.1 5-formyltetrahydrofolate cyclo-ligase [Heyndrickxia sporothermodurans]MBL5769503.1 5-formyltetrahydrofolate cyclo-ligase [Heyndrickxia sporothermodurans]MBL5773284.1 5-formyltetrahydrofolate cyclo-ligase [Heyndrickxia sporothermodurans]MBL5777087.1 5-formyltetrahydrofolate cyclo-ligase [Heyndrickxia sporothermodurans]MBL5780495.1 5-formyltetrahydrofolate cyclo-ligase [Heyndrickxia sporothermodurans]
MEKKELRECLKKDLSSIDRCTYEQNSYLIAKQLFGHPKFNAASTVAITLSRFPEVDTWQIIRKGWEVGKRMVVPKCIPKTKEMVFKEITSFKQLESVYFGLFEPIDGQTTEVKKEELDLIIVPGIAFTRNGYRLGFGGGYYDRFLHNYQGMTISLAFSSQIQSELPIEKHDIPVQRIITENETIHCSE